METDNRMFLDQVLCRHGDDVPDLSTGDIGDPVGSFIAKTQRETLAPGLDAITKARWDEPLTSPMEKHTAPSIFEKGTFGHKLGLTRVEEKIIDGETWHYGYRGDQLVDARLIQA